MTTRPPPTDDEKRIARHEAASFGGGFRVQTYWDAPEGHFVDILAAADAPGSGVTSYATIGLSNWPLYINGVEYLTRLELVGACATTVGAFPNLMSTASMFVIKDRWACYPGAIFPGLVGMYPGLSSTMNDLFFVPPFLWDDGPATLSLGERTVAWLQAVPISEAEHGFAERFGTDALMDRFVQAQIDVFDVSRPSLI
jgi:hypothetical protein